MEVVLHPYAATAVAVQTDVVHESWSNSPADVPAGKLTVDVVWWFVYDLLQSTGSLARYKGSVTSPMVVFQAC